MSETIFKYRLPMCGLITLQLPPRAKPLSVQMQDNAPFLWVQVNPTSTRDSADECEERTFFVATTGGELPKDAEYYIGTCQTDDSYVVHVYELKAKPKSKMFTYEVTVYVREDFPVVIPIKVNAPLTPEDTKDLLEIFPGVKHLFCRKVENPDAL